MVQSDGQESPPVGAAGMETSPFIFRFGPFEARPSAQELSKNGTRVRLRGQPFFIFELLLSRAGEVVTRDEVRQKLWPVDTFVDFEHGLNTSIKKLRRRSAIPRMRPAISRPCHGWDTVSLLRLKPFSNQDRRRRPGGRRDALLALLTARESGHAGVPPRTVICPGRLVLVTRDRGAGGGGADFQCGERREIGSLYCFGQRRMRPWRSLLLPNRPVRSRCFPCRIFPTTQTEDYFADGMTDELTTDLAQFGSLRVISRTSAMHYKGANKTAPEIGRELGVDTLIEGTVQRVGKRVRIRVQLIDSATDRHLWARSYDHELKRRTGAAEFGSARYCGRSPGKVCTSSSRHPPVNQNPVKARGLRGLS